jgi:lipopolysaccharide biosynthesis protein
VSKGSSRTVAFYLPQFHPIPQNDEWWGDGFTEWTNVTRATPLFDGHDQPRVPAELGYYDLRDTEVLHRQAELARRHDIDAFCMYFYWFDGKRLLERPLDAYLADGPDFPFCLSWANEHWTRRWDGKDREILMGQSYSPGSAEEVFRAMRPYLTDRRYLRVEGLPVLLVHRADHLPDAKAFASAWRRLAVEWGLGGLYLVAAETVPGLDSRSLGFDAVAEFPPVGANTLRASRLVPPRRLDRGFRGRLMDYARLAERFSTRENAPFPRHRGVMPGWDNTARRRHAATIYLRSSPDQYSRWLRRARACEDAARGAAGLVFVNAWNEWAEGAYLEPDRRHGDAYLRATRRTPTEGLPGPAPCPPGVPGAGFLRSLAHGAAASLLAAVRRMRLR